MSQENPVSVNDPLDVVHSHTERGLLGAWGSHVETLAEVGLVAVIHWVARPQVGGERPRVNPTLTTYMPSNAVPEDGDEHLDSGYE